MSTKSSKKKYPKDTLKLNSDGSIKGSKLVKVTQTKTIVLTKEVPQVKTYRNSISQILGLSENKYIGVKTKEQNFHGKWDPTKKSPAYIYLIDKDTLESIKISRKDITEINSLGHNFIFS